MRAATGWAITTQISNLFHFNWSSVPLELQHKEFKGVKDKRIEFHQQRRGLHNEKAPFSIGRKNTLPIPPQASLPSKINSHMRMRLDMR